MQEDSGLSSTIVYSCGNADLNGHRVSQKNLAVLRSLSRVVVTKIECGSFATVALTQLCEVWQWGSPDTAIPGLRNVPTKVGGLPFIEEVATSHCLSNYPELVHFAAISTAGELFTWGRGEAGQLLHGDTQTLGKPKQVAFFGARRVLQITLGGQMMLVAVAPAVTTPAAATLAPEAAPAPDVAGSPPLPPEACVFIGGTFTHKRYRGVLRREFKPIEVPALRGKPIAQLSAFSQNNGCCTAFALEANGDLYSWLNSWMPEWNYLGHGPHILDLEEPRLIEPLARRVRRMTCTAGFLGCVTSDGAVFTWGCNRGLGHGQGYSGKTVPTQIEALRDVHVRQLTAGSSEYGISAGALTESGDCYFWGKGDGICDPIAGQNGIPEKYALNGIPVGFKAAQISVNADLCVICVEKAGNN